MNRLAAKTFASKQKVYPVGAAIVKQKMIHSYTSENGRFVPVADH
jgi:hypothetical protein